MPYSGPGDSKLPENVKKLPDNLKAQWVEVFNSAYKNCNAKNGQDCESSAFAQAWGVVNKHRNYSKFDYILARIVKLAQDFFSYDANDVTDDAARAIKHVSSWDGSASKYGGAKAYCDACLINVNEGDPSTWTQDKCMLPIREPGDGGGTYVDKAVHAAAGGHGITQVQKPDGVDSGKWEAAVKSAANKLISAYNAMGEVAPAAVYKCAGKSAPMRSLPVVEVFDAVYLQVQAKDPLAWITDVFTDDNGGLFAVIASNGKLYRADISVDKDVVLAQEWQEIKADLPAMQTLSKSSGHVIRQKDGRYRLLSISCSSMLNRMGQIDSKALFDSFIEHANTTGEYPIRMFYHAGKSFRTGQVDWIGRDDNLLLMSTLYDDTDIARREVAARQKDPEFWGDSIGFDPLEGELVEVSSGIKIPVYTRGICKEVSTLPENQAAAWHTTTATVKEVFRMLNDTQFAAFVKFFEGEPDPEAAAKSWLEQNSATRNRAIEDAGAITRATDLAEPVAQVADPVVVEPVAPTQPEQPAQPVVDPVTTTPVPDVAAEPTVTNAAPVVVEPDKPAEQPKPADTPKPPDDALVSKVVDAVMAKLTPLLENLGVELGKATNQATQFESRIKALELPEEAKKRAYLQDVSPTLAAPVQATFRPSEQRVETNADKNASYDEVAAETLSRCPVKY